MEAMRNFGAFPRASSDGVQASRSANLLGAPSAAVVIRHIFCLAILSCVLENRPGRLEIALLHSPSAVTDVTRFLVFEILLYPSVAIFLVNDRATHGRLITGVPLPNSLQSPAALRP
jgi:hypothetical protein